MDFSSKLSAIAFISALPKSTLAIPRSSFVGQRDRCSKGQHNRAFPRLKRELASIWKHTREFL